MSFRILHVDDDPDIREIVELSLSLDPSFAVMSCACGDDALAKAADQAPDLILCDVMMPGMDGPAVLARLRENGNTAKTPVVFMTARAQTRELEHFKSLGAAAVITKPFDPMKLADAVRGHLRSDKIAAVEDGFVQRLRKDAILLAQYRDHFQSEAESPALLENIQSCTHKLAGAAGVFNYQAVSVAASALEETIIAQRAGQGVPGRVEANFDALLESIAQE
jgi:CheY-like chemotaxis protein